MTPPDPFPTGDIAPLPPLWLMDNHRGGHITKLMLCPAELQGRSHSTRVRRSKTEEQVTERPTRVCRSRVASSTSGSVRADRGRCARFGEWRRTSGHPADSE
jgi:hypothetical protein